MATRIKGKSEKDIINNDDDHESPFVKGDGCYWSGYDARGWRGLDDAGWMVDGCMTISPEASRLRTAASRLPLRLSSVSKIVVIVTGPARKVNAAITVSMLEM